MGRRIVCSLQSAICKVIDFTIDSVCVQMLHSHVAASTVHAAVRPVSLELLLHPAAISEVRHCAVTVLVTRTCICKNSVEIEASMLTLCRMTVHTYTS